MACSSLCWGIPTVTALIQRKPIVRFRRAEHIVEITEGSTEFVGQERTRRSQYAPYSATPTERSRGSGEAPAHGHGSGLGSGSHAELGEEVGHVGLDGANPDEERPGDLAVGLAGHQLA